MVPSPSQHVALHHVDELAQDRALHLLDLARALAGLALHRLRAVFGARAVAGLAQHLLADADLLLDAGRDLVRA